MLVPFKLMINKFFTLFFASVILFCCSIKATEASSVIGTDGRDMIVADSVTTRVEAGRGDDFIIGGVGDNTYVISKDDGADTIYELSGNNTVEFDAGISFSDIASGLMKSGDDLVLRIGQGGQTLTVKFFFSHSNTINQFRLSNGQTISNAQLFGAFGMAAPTATAALPELVTAQAPDSELTGSANAEVLIARHGTLLMQSLAGNDILVPRGPAVTMEFGLNSGKNLIVAYEGNNTILFGADVAFNDIAMNLRRSGDDLQLINSQDGSEVTVYQFFTRANTISQIRFTSGGDIDAAQLFGLFGVAPPEQAHHYYMVAPGVSFDNNAPGEGNGDGGDDGGGSGGGDDGDGSGGGEDPDPCQGDSCDTGDETNFVIIDGTAQDDLLISDERASLFRAGTGNDIMLGGAGNNRYVIAKGDGADVIIDTEGSNEVHFAADIAWSDISSGLVRSGNDLMLRIGQSGQTLTIQSFFTLANTIELFKLDSGQTLTRQQLFPIFSATAPSQSLPARQLILGRSGETLLQGTEGGDILLNRMAVTSIDAKAGDDIIIAQYTAPSYETDAEGTVYSWDEQRLTLQFEAGHGKDVVYTLGDTALKVHLNFAEGVSRQTVFQNMRRMANDLIIKTYSAADELRFVNFFSHYNHLAEMKFADDDGVSIYDTDIYEGFNSEQPEQPLQLVVGLSGNTLLSCEDLFARHDSAALSDFQHDVDLNIQPPSNLVASIHRKTFIPFTVANANDVLTCFMLESAPAQMTMHPDSGLLSWAPERGDIGTKDITITVVTDGQTYNQAQFTLLVPDLNQPPVFTNNPKNVAFATVSFEDRISAGDNDNYNDAIEFSLVTAPAGLTLTPINNTQADILWQPNAEQVGTHDVVIRAQDKYGKYSELSYSIEVKTFHTLANVPPGYSKVPKTGAITFDSAREDGSTRLGTERVFERDHAREVVRDRVSDLVWQDNAEVLDLQTSYGGAKQYCQNLEHGGITDWRLPTRLELAYLPNMDTRKYEDAFKFGWVSSRYEKSFHAEKVFGTHYADTRSWETIVDRIPRSLNITDHAYVRCVSGAKPYQPKYVRATLFDVVADSTHLLLWEDQARILGQESLAWEEQAQYCANLDLAGFDDWRLPNNYESQTLASLFDENGGGLFNGSARMPFSFKYLPLMSGDSFGSWLSANKGTYFKYRRGNEHYVFDMTAQVDRDPSNGVPLTGYSRCVRTYSPAVAKVTTLQYGVYANDTIRLDAGGTYATESRIVRYQWKSLTNQQILGEGEAIDVSFDMAGQYQIELTVWDQIGLSEIAPDIVTVNVKSLPVPVVTIPTEGLTVGQNIVLDASGSYFTDGEIKAFRWYSLPDNQLLGEGNNINVTASQPGLMQYRLEIIYDDGRVLSHIVEFTVTAEPPVAHIAAVPTALPVGSALTLDGSASSDADGEIVAYRWYRLPEQTLVGEQNTLVLNALTAGLHQYRLEVEDNSGLTSDVIVAFTFTAEPPLAHIAAVPAVLPVGSNLTLDASASSDADGEIVAYRWYRLPEQMMVGEQSTLVLNTIAAGLHQYRLEVEDNIGLTGDVQVSFEAGYVPVAVIDGTTSAYLDTELTLNALNSTIISGQLSYNWQLDQEYVSDQAVVTLNLSQAGTYQLTLQVTSELGFSDSSSVALTILPSRELTVCPVQPVTDDRGYNGLYPDDNIAWTGGNAETVDDIARAFNYARSLDPSVHQYLLMPEQAQWDAMSVQQKGLYLVNAERVARGIKPYAGFDAAMVEVAQTYATYIQSRNQVIGHYNDGRSPMQRMQAHSYIGANADSFISKPESVAGATDPNPISDNIALAKAIYFWLYYDKDWFVAFGIDGTPWGHRNHLLQTGLDDNHADNTTEGVVGFGLAKGLYQPGVNPVIKHGAVTVFKTIDQGPSWDNSRIQTVDVSQARGCPVHQLEVDVNEAELSGLRQLTITPASVHLAVGQSTQLSLTGIYSDGSQRDLTALAQFKADAYSVVSVQNGVLYAEQTGDTTVSVSLAGIESNRVVISIGEPADTTVLNGTEAEPLKAYIAENATVHSINPLAVAVYSGVVQDRYGYPMADVQLSLLKAPEYGSVKTNADGRFMLAGPAGEQTVVYEKPGYVVLQRSTIGASSSWAALPNVTLLERDSKQSLIDLTAGTAQVHQSSVISDEFGERRATVVFNGITSAEIRSQNGARRPISQFMFSATEFETPASMPGELPAETAFTWASDLHVDGTHYTDSVHYNADVVLYLDNFLGFPVGEIVPVGYFDRTISKWIASPNGVVVRLLDTNGDGTVDGVDYNDDGIADDINSDGSTADEAIGLTGYAAGDTLWRAAFDHMTPYDLNWSAGSDGRDPNNPDADANGETELDIEECTAVGSYVTPKPLVLHDDIGITGTGIALHYSSQRTAGYQHKITATVSDDELPAGVVEMIATLEVAGRLFEQRFAPAINQQVEFIWDGNNAAGKRVEGGVRAQLRIGYAYPAAYLSSGNAASSGQPLSSFPMAWAQWGQTVTNVAGRENDVRWSSNVVPLFNIPQSPIANGWSLSEHHVLSPFNRIYLGDGSTMDVEAAGKVLKTGITESQYPGDDGSYQQFGADISYSITSHGTVQDNVTGLQWQHLTSPAVRFATKAQANSYCAALPQNPDTALPWRLPTSKEVAYTIDKAANVQFMAMYTTEMQSYWKQNTYNPDNRMIPALCVSGEPLDEKYSRELQASPADEVVVDSATGLMWQDSPANSSLQFGWQQAIDYCENLDHAGFEDWRLPNVNELSYALPNTVFSHQTSLPEMQQGRPWSPGVDFRRPYWASTPNVMAAATQAWALESAGYSHHRYEHTEQYYARCVRNDLTSIKSPYVFDRSGKHVRTLDQVTGKVLMHFDYNSAGQLVAVRDRFDNSLTIRRDSNGVATELETSDGYITRLTVDHQHDLRSVQYADNSAYSFSNVNGQIIEKRDPNGHLFSRGYDQHGRISYSDDSEGGIWRFFSERDTNTGNLRYGYTTAEDNLYETQLSKLSNGDLQQRIRFTDDSLQQSIRAADGLRNSYQSAGVSSVVDKTRDAVTGQPIPANISNTMPSGLQQQTVLQKQYGSNGTDTSRVTVSINTNGKVSTIHNDAVTGVKTELSAAQREVVYQYDPQTLLLSSVQVSGLATEHYRYDSRGRLVQTHAGDRLTQFEYAAHGKGNVTAVTDAEGYVTEYSYDVMGRVTSTRYPDGTELVLSYDSNGNVSSLTPPGQPAHQFHYNGVGNESAYTPPAVAGATVATTHYHYDRDRKLTGITRPDSQQINFSYATGSSQLQSLQAPQGDYAYSYNTHGQLTAVTSPYGIHNSYSYDGNLPLTESWSGLINGEVSYSYNNDFAVTAQCINGTDCINYSYDADGLITAAGNLNLTLAAQQGGVLTATQLGNIISVLEHNDFAELNSVTSRFNSQPLHSMALVRDNLGRITRKTEIVGADTVVSDYHYNSNGRLYKVVRNGDTVEYSFDANDNRLSKTSGSGVVSASYDAQDRLLTHGTCSYSYSANGELQQKQCGDAVTQYQYDVFGNLQSVTLPDSGAGVTSIEYLIDASNRRVGKTVNGTVQYGLLYGDQLNPVAQLDANNNVVARFVYGSLGNVPDYMVKGGVTYRIITDQLGSVRLVVNSQTGDIAQQLSYDEFGIVTQDTNPGFQPFGWAGGLYDADTGLTRFGARDYDAQTGRWTSKDPIRFGGGDSNLYGYVLGDPVNFIDPTGEILQVIVGRALFGAAREFLYQVVIEGRSLGCVDYWQVGAAALQGAFTGGVGGNAARSGIRGTAKSQYTNKQAREAATRNGYVEKGSNSHGPIFHKPKADPAWIGKSDTGHGPEMFKGYANQKQAEAGRKSKDSRLGSYDANMNKIGG